MIAVLEQPETRELVVPISPECYREAGQQGLLGEDVELIEGVILKKMPKSPLHILLVRRLLALLESVLDSSGQRQGWFISKEDPIAIHDSEPEPDLALLSGSPEDYGHRLPETAKLVIEVAVSTLEKDRFKARIYASAGVEEYWIVDGDNRQIERFSGPVPEENRYETHDIFLLQETDPEKAVASRVLEGFRLRPAELFRQENQ